MTDAEKSVKNLVTETNLRLVGLWAPQPDTRGPSAGSACTKEEPKQQPPVSPPRRRPTWVTIGEPAGTPQAERPSAPLGKGKKKAIELVDLSDDSSDDNDMDSANAFDLYSAPEAAAVPPSKKKTSKRHQGESSKAPQAKKARNTGPSEDMPSATTTPPSPHEQQTPSAMAGPTPPPAALTDQPQQVDPT
ncbi:proline-rich receptor-like protein kinase PERK10 [Humulus lupulus]|uniref:proline-rich receptor-like protein kinase PERK10 n=1 Tax=Humulus lupulus TaxID=3486 RepID=UPI002B409DA2|nr:proline-rich receptor-like protein kinase PERK10 [Humulus lupulus]